jgi:hypothetical protein
MGFDRWCSDVFWGTGRRVKILAAALLVLMLAVATSRAGDLLGQPADGLSVTNSATDVLPQAAAGAPPPVPGEQAGGLAGLHISGYGSQTFGMWQNPTNLKWATPSRNSLAVSRSLLQVDENYRLNENNTFFMREWFVYEPPYSFDSANNKQYVDAAHASYGHMLNGYYNNYQVRDAWWENKTGPLTTFIGNQIVVWGQSLAFRVGDVINPADTCWAFGFANLEQSRDAQWMVHPILNLPELGPFTSNFLELVVQPGFQPRWWPEQTNDPYAKYRDEMTAGRALPCLPSASHGPSGRFDVQYSTNPIFGADAPLAPLGPYVTGGAQTTIKIPGTEIPMFHPMVDPPAAREFFVCLPFLVRRGFIPPQFKHFHAACNLGMNKHNNPVSPIGDGGLVDVGFWHVPGMQPQNWNDGARFHTLYGATEWTALYYNDNVNQGAPFTLKWRPFTNLWDYGYPDIQEGAVTVDRPMPMPASLAEYFPAVFRGEVLYQNHVSFESNKFSDMNGQRWSDVVKYMVAIDLDQAYAPWLTSTGNLSANLEVFHTIIMDNSKLSYFGNDLNERNLKNDVSLLFHVGTSWWWQDFAPDWAMIFNPKGRTFALFPSIVLNPPWTKKYFLKLQAIEILGGDKEAGVGLFKGQNYLIAQFQYNFNIM